MAPLNSSVSPRRTCTTRPRLYSVSRVGPLEVLATLRADESRTLPSEINNRFRVRFAFTHVGPNFRVEINSKLSGTDGAASRNVARNDQHRGRDVVAAPRTVGEFDQTLTQGDCRRRGRERRRQRHER